MVISIVVTARLSPSDRQPKILHTILHRPPGAAGHAMVYRLPGARSAQLRDTFSAPLTNRASHPLPLTVVPGDARACGLGSTATHAGKRTRHSQRAAVFREVIDGFQAFHRTAVKAGVEPDLFTAIGEGMLPRRRFRRAGGQRERGFRQPGAGSVHRDPPCAASFEEEVVMVGEVDEIGLDVDRSHLQTASCLTVLPGPTRDRQLGLGVITEWP